MIKEVPIEVIKVVEKEVIKEVEVLKEVPVEIIKHVPVEIIKEVEKEVRARRRTAPHTAADAMAACLSARRSHVCAGHP